MHMVSKKDPNYAEFETVRVSKSPTMVGNSQWRVLVSELDLFVTVMLLEDTPAVLSRGNLTLRRSRV